LVERLSRAAAHRLSLYLRVLAAWPADGGKVSSSRIASACHVTDAQVRRDLAALGSLGQRGIGYEARELTSAIRAALGIDRNWPAVLVGVGNLARALLRYRAFRAQGFDVVGLFDTDPAKIGQVIEGVKVEPIAALGERVVALKAELAVLTVPAEGAQEVADTLVKSGIRGVLNFAPVLLKLPPKVKLVAVDLAIQLEQLAFLIQLGEAPLDDEP
jgi:redox-sensing transcriptional repressor